MPKPQTLQRVVPSHGDGRVTRRVVRNSNVNRLPEPETSGTWRPVRQSHAMEHVKPFPSVGLPWTNFPRVTQIVGVSNDV